MQSPTRSRVLYVDNDADTCEMVRLLFSSHGIEVCCAGSAADAVLRIKSVQFDLLILDVWLPDTNGLEFCREVRRSDSKTPILFYSGAAYESDIANGLAAGANAYLVKPDIDGLTEAARRLVENRSTHAISHVKRNRQETPARNSPATY